MHACMHVFPLLDRLDLDPIQRYVSTCSFDCIVRFINFCCALRTLQLWLRLLCFGSMLVDACMCLVSPVCLISGSGSFWRQRFLLSAISICVCMQPRLYVSMCQACKTPFLSTQRERAGRPCRLCSLHVCVLCVLLAVCLSLQQPDA